MVQILRSLFFLFMALSVINATLEPPNEMNMDLNKLAIANNELAMKLYRILALESPGNVFFSPFSLSNAFGMLFAGARNNTAEELKSVLGYDIANLPSSKVSSAFNHYLNRAIPKNQSRDSDYALNLANELLVAKNFNVSQQYKEEVQNQFHVYIKEVDFEKNSPQIKKDVNNWVKHQTNGKIDDLMSDLDPSTTLLLLNAIYFKGDWKVPFEQELTKPQIFYNEGSDSKAKEVPFMHMTKHLPYLSMKRLKMLELPYKGENISMIIILPNRRNGLKGVEHGITITPDILKRLQKKLSVTEVHVSIPKFKVQYKRQLIPDFKKLGVKDIFVSGEADLSGITPAQELHVSEVIHKAAIEVNEEGSEAAAVTDFEITLYSRRPRFTVEHPFMYAIIDKRNDMILFLGRVTQL